MRTRTAVVTVLVLLLLGAAGQEGRAQGIEAEVADATERLEEARSNHLHLIAPGHFRDAREALVDARRRLNRDGNIREIRERLQRFRQALGRAQDLLDVGRVLLEEALEAREDALAAGAPELASRRWSEAESRILEAGEEVEDGDQNDARSRAAEAARAYREAERTAVRTDVLGRARDLRRSALEREADDRAPRTLGRADSLLARAEEILRGDLARQGEARPVAERAAEEFRHAARIAAVADTFRDRDGGIETLLLRSEAGLARIADSLGFEPRFDEGLGPVTDQIAASVRSLQQDRANLQDELASVRKELSAELKAARARSDSLRRRLEELGERVATVSEELRARREREAKMREIRAIFSEGEAEVAVTGDQLVIRLVGMSFPVGSAEIRPENYALLTKLQQVLREFPEAPVTITGHTDSRGNDEANRQLSTERAIAVREYILANMAVSADRFSSRGFGESQPIASNDTEEGRARNRRIDVRIDLSEAGGSGGS